MNKEVVFIILLGLVTSAVAIKWKDCGSKGGKVESIEISGCATATICPLPHNTNVSFSVTFTASEAVSKSTAAVYGLIKGIPIPFPIDNPDGCKDSGLTCPLKSANKYVYKQQIFVRSSYPKIRVVVEWKLKDQDNKDIFCIEVPTQIVEQKPKKEDNTLYFKPHH